MGLSLGECNPVCRLNFSTPYCLPRTKVGEVNPLNNVSLFLISGVQLVELQVSV